MRAHKRTFIGAIALLGLGFEVLAHDSPSHVIESLTRAMGASGPSARLLTARAYEHRALGDGSAAIADFLEALKLEPRYDGALFGGAETLLSQGRWSDAESLARQGVDTNASVVLQASYHALLARIYAGQQRWTEARDAWRAALHSPVPEVDWFLGEAESVGRLSGPDEQVLILTEAVKRNPSVVLRRAWIRAMVDAGRLEPALNEIEKGLTDSRWLSTWLLLRARIHEQRGDVANQRADAAKALAELRSRMNPERPDAYLVAETGMALVLLGEQEKARGHLQQARELGVSDGVLTSVHR